MSKISTYVNKINRKPIIYHVNYIKRLFHYHYKKSRAILRITLSNKQLHSSLNLDFETTKDIANYFKERHSPIFFINQNQKDMYLSIINLTFNDSISETIKSANQICIHRFNLLGSGLTDLGKKINWHKDFKSGYVWPKVYYKKIYYKDYDKGYDIKIPRELSRFQHLVPLGKAYWYTDDEKYAQEFVAQIDDWINENPPEIGLNWQCIMDVAIRIANWIWGFYFFKDSKYIKNDFIIRFLKSCLIHGRHIRNNLEWNEHVTSNHYISDLVGLIFLGIMFPEFKEASEWLSYSREELLKELHKQVYNDGMDYEASTAYHRLVLELYYTTALLLKLNGHEWPDWAWNKIHQMFNFIKGIIKPNGKIPQIGDNDSGRLQILENRKDDLDFTYLFPIAAILFNDSSFKLRYIDFSEEALWLLGHGSYHTYTSMRDDKAINDLPSCFFQDGGLYIIRSKKNYCIVSCGPNGQNGNGGHAHNDKLSFELNIKGEDIILDPGTYLYTGDYRIRNLFRSNQYHNTIRVDNQEINEFDPYKLFQLKDSCEIKIHFFGKKGTTYTFTGEHNAYSRLNYPVLHKRSISHHQNTNHWSIYDSLTGPDGFAHHFEKFIHFAPNCRLRIVEKDIPPDIVKLLTTSFCFNNSKVNDIKWNSCLINKNNLTLYYIFGSNHNLQYRISKGWISSGYGLKETAPILSLSFLSSCPAYFYSLIIDKL